MSLLTLTLSLDANAHEQAAWDLDGQPLGSPLAVGSPSLAEIEQPLLTLFEDRSRRPLTNDEELRALGARLFDRCFAPVWQELHARLAGPSHDLLIRSGEGRLLNLPWELVELTPGLPLGCDAGWSLRRTPLPQLDDRPPALDGGPLRLLFLAAAPTDQPQLDYEREEDAVQRTASRLRGDVVLHFAEAGSVRELGELAAAVRPHIIRLSGHGEVGKDGVGRFAFEDERGRSDLRTAADLAAEVLRGNPSIRCVFLNGCQTAQAAAAGLCQELVRAGLPLAVGWAASVVDDTATDFTAAGYNRLLLGETLPAALAHARQAIRQQGRSPGAGGVVQDATFALPQLYASAASSALYDPAAPRTAYRGPRTERALLGDGIKGLKEGFVGRRREVQRLVPALRDGDVTFAVLTGLGGAGKSTLATRAADALEGAGFRVLPVRTREGKDPAERARQTLSKLIAGLERAFIQAGREDLRGQLTDGKLTLETRLRLAVDGLTDLRLVIVLDNFEEALDLATRRIADPDLAGFYRALAENLVGGSRVVVTCRYLPADTPEGLPTVLHLPLPDLEEHAFLKFLRRDEAVNGRIKRGELPGDLLRRLFRRLGGTPRFLEGVRLLLRKADANDLEEQVAAAPDAAFAREREEYLEGILVGRLFDALPADGRDLASRLAVSELPIPAEAAGPLAALEMKRTSTALAAGVAYGLVQEFAAPDLPMLYHTPGLLRPWLSRRLAEAEASQVHAQLALFWRKSFEADREEELRVLLDVELSACREHSHRGGDRLTFRWATVRLSCCLTNQARWASALELLAEVPEAERNGDFFLARSSANSKVGEWMQARNDLERALALLTDETEARAAATAWHELASIDLNEGSYAAARDKFYRSLDILKSLGHQTGEAAVWHGLATIDLNEGAYPAARDKFGRSLEIKEAIGDRAGQGATWHQLATIDLEEGLYAPARDKFGRSLEIARALGNRPEEAAIRLSLGVLDFNEGSYITAREHLRRSLEITQVINDRPCEAAVWHQLATIDMEQGLHEAAREKFRGALKIRQAIGDRPGEAVTLQNLGSLDLKEGSYMAAREQLQRSMEIRQAIGDRAGLASALHQLAMIDIGEKSYAAARDKLGRSLEIRRAVGDRPGEAAALHNLATIDSIEGRYPSAYENYLRSLEINRSIGAPYGEGSTFFQLGLLADEMGRRSAAVRLLAVSWLIKRQIGHSDAAGDLRTILWKCSKLGYEQEQVEAMLQEVARSYRQDRGRSLLATAFPPSDASP
jgi:tetratricopeptide (TPR) repeat protein